MRPGGTLLDAVGRRQKKLWVRAMPENPYVVHEGNLDVPFRHGMVDYEFQDKLSRHFAKKRGTTAVMVGLRADESLNRYAAVARGKKGDPTRAGSGLRRPVP